MARVTLSVDGVVLKEVALTKDRTTLGRRPYNDIVIDNLTVSGEHAVLHLAANQAWVEDLRSTNGTHLRGRAISQREALQHGDTLGIGTYTLTYWADAANSASAAASSPAPSTASAAVSRIKVLSGAASGREIPLTQAVTTLGKPGVLVAAITRQPQGYVVHRVEGEQAPMLNGAPIGPLPLALKHGDVITLAGTQMQFIHA